MLGLLKNKVLGIDSRKSQRIPICVLVEETGQEKDYFDKTRDVSLKGLFIETEDLKEIGEAVTLRFALPGCPPVTVAGKVSRVQKTNGVYLQKNGHIASGMAIEFTDLNTQSQDVIQKFIG